MRGSTIKQGRNCTLGSLVEMVLKLDVPPCSDSAGGTSQTSVPGRDACWQPAGSHLIGCLSTVTKRRPSGLVLVRLSDSRAVLYVTHSNVCVPMEEVAEDRCLSLGREWDGGGAGTGR